MSIFGFFRLPFLHFLVFDVLSDLFCMQPNRVDTIPSGPEMITPIGFFFQFAKLVENTNRRSAFQCSDIARLRGEHDPPLRLVR